MKFAHIVLSHCCGIVADNLFRNVFGYFSRKVVRYLLLCLDFSINRKDI